MANFNDCMQKALATGELRADTFNELINTFKQDPDQLMNMESKKQFSEDVLRHMEKKKQQAKDIIRAKERVKGHIDTYIETYNSIKFTKDQKVNKANHAVMALLADEKGIGAGFMSVEGIAKSTRNIIKSDLVDAMDDLRTTVIQTRDKSLSEDIIRAMFNKQDTNIKNSKASKYSDDFSKAFDKLFDLYKDSGGAIQKRNNWRTPTMHSQSKIAKAPMDEWVADIKQMSSSVSQYDDEILEGIYKSIATDGVAKLNPKLIDPKFSKMAKEISRLEHRIIDFDNADSWLKYNSKYGQDDVFNGFMEHIDTMSNDIGLLKVFGSKPNVVLEWSKQYAKTIDGTIENGIDGLYNIVSGYADSLHLTNGWRDHVVNFFGGLRNILNAALLGRAAITSLTDIGSSAAASRLHKMSIFSHLGEAVKTMSSKEKQKFAARLTGNLDTWRGSVASSRFDDAIGNGITGKISNTVMRSSGIQLWTDSMRRSFGTEFLQMFEDIRKQPLNKLNETQQQVFRGYGITDQEWNTLGKIKDSEHFQFDHSKIDDIDLQIKFMNMLRGEMETAVLEPNARTRLWTTLGERRGTAKGEIPRIVMQFKSFPVTFMNQHFSRILKMNSTKGKIGYATSLLSVGIVMGAVSIQLKNLADGKTTEDMGNREFFMKALTTSGGFGIYGDIIFGTGSKFGANDLTDVLAGPSLGSMSKFIKAGQKLSLEAIDEKAKGGRSIAKTAYSMLPFQNLWFTKGLTDRMIKDNLLDLIDENGNRKSKRRYKNIMRKKGQKHYWEYD